METNLVFNADETFTIGVPFVKMDTEKRIVEGFATLNNVDQAGDVVESDASQEAFADWIGNIREMHEKKAVGKAVDFYPETYTDPKTGKSYEGMWVKARISKGAEDTWQKVLDGTLAGFSIGGATLAKQRDIMKSDEGTNQNIWRITKYRLTELSLVDNPCNGMARISLVKSVDGISQVEDTIADVEVVQKACNGETGEHVDLSPELRSVVAALENWRDAAIAGNADYEASRASDLLASMRSSLRWEKEEATYMTKSDKGDKEMTTETTETGTEVLQKNDEADTPVLDALSDEDKGIIRKFVDFIKGSEATPAEEDLTKNNKEGENTDMNTEDLTKAIDTVTEELTKSVDEKFGQVGESLTKITDLLEKVATTEVVDELKKELEAKVATLTERLETLETSGAVKKSGDETVATEKFEKSDEGFWGGSVLPDFLNK